MLTAQQLAYTCLEYIGEFSLTLVGYTGDAGTGVRRALLRAQNQALEELFELNAELFKREIGLTVLAPQTGTVAVTAHSAAVSATSFTSTLAGNTILISGQAEYNALRLEGAAKKLLFPYTGPTGTQAATLYGDVLAFDATLSRPLGPVWLSDIRALTPLADKFDLLAYGYDRQYLASDWGRHGPSGVARSVQPRRTAQPEAFYIEPHLLESGLSQLRLVLAPMPDREYSLRFDAAVRPLAVTDADLGNATDPDPARLFALPDQKDHHFLLPLVLYHWSKSAFFKDADARKLLAAEYDATVPQIAAWRVQPQTGSYLNVGGWR